MSQDSETPFSAAFVDRARANADRRAELEALERAKRARVAKKDRECTVLFIPPYTDDEDE